MEVFESDVKVTDKDRLHASGFNVSRPIKTGLIWTSPISGLEDGCLLVDRGSTKKGTASNSFLWKFIELAEQDDSKVVAFARKWGALGVGPDGWRRTPDSNREPISGWRLLARRLQAALNLAAEFQQGRPGYEKDYLALIAGDSDATTRFAYFKPWKMKEPYQTELQSMLNAMIRRFGVAPRIWWNEDRKQWQVDLDSTMHSNIPAILVLLLLSQIGDKYGFAICSACQTTYDVKRRPDPTRRNYCGACKKAANRDAARDKRARDRERKANGKTR